MVKSRTELELIATPAASIGGSPGEGTFTVDADRLQLAPVVLQSVKHRLLLYLQNEDLVGYRVCLNLQTVFLRGFPADPLGDLIPGFDEANLDTGSLPVSRFLFQNGFSAVGDVDSQGWSPLHYGALAGDPVLLRSLLEHRAHLDRLTRKPQPQAGVPPRTSALSICLMFKHNEAARVLLAAKAQAGVSQTRGSDYKTERVDAKGSWQKQDAVRSAVEFNRLSVWRPWRTIRKVFAFFAKPAVSLTRRTGIDQMCSGSSCSLIYCPCCTCSVLAPAEQGR